MVKVPLTEQYLSRDCEILTCVLSLNLDLFSLKTSILYRTDLYLYTVEVFNEEIPRFSEKNTS